MKNLHLYLILGPCISERKDQTGRHSLRDLRTEGAHLLLHYHRQREEDFRTDLDARNRRFDVEADLFPNENSSHEGIR